MTQTTKYTREQNELIAEFCMTYGLEPDQITFFPGDPKPFFDREATAKLIHTLTDAVGVEDDVVAAQTPDSIAVKYKVTFEDGSFASSTGVANLNQLRNGEPMSFEEIKSLATSRASRGAMTNKGIDLVKLHYRAKNGNVSDFAGQQQRGQYESLLREAHALGRETGFILDVLEADPKRAWYAVLMTRYGASSCNTLNIDQLADFVAFLRSQLPAKQAA